MTMDVALKCRVLLLAIFIYPITEVNAKLQAADLPLNTALDDKGQPLLHSTNKPLAMEYQAADHMTVQAKPKKPEKRRSKKTRFKDLSRKQMLRSRKNVANDPSCRWLNQRMILLERKLMNTMSGMDMRFGYHQKELNLRKKEWVCLKCGVEGPNVYDYAKCQFQH